MGRIKEVVPQEDYKLFILLDNGSSITLNMKGRLNTVRFGMLADKEFFNKVTSDGSFLRWDNKIEISMNEIFELAKR